MQYKMSKSQWQQIGMKAGWLKTSSEGAGDHRPMDSSTQTPRGKFNFDLDKLRGISEVGGIVNSSEEEKRSFVDSVQEEKAQEIADMLVDKIDRYIDNANASRELALRSRHSRELQFKKEKIFIHMSNNLSKVLEMLKVKFPSINVREQANKLMTMEDSMKIDEEY